MKNLKIKEKISKIGEKDQPDWRFSMIKQDESEIEANKKKNMS